MAAPVEPAWRFYETVAASQTAQILGTTGAKGDKIARIVYVPATTAAGVVTLLDGSTSIPIFVGGGTTALIDRRERLSDRYRRIYLTPKTCTNPRECKC
jgi:hypothetical protein